MYNSKKCPNCRESKRRLCLTTLPSESLNVRTNKFIFLQNSRFSDFWTFGQKGSLTYIFFGLSAPSVIFAMKQTRPEHGRKFIYNGCSKTCQALCHTKLELKMLKFDTFTQLGVNTNRYKLLMLFLPFSQKWVNNLVPTIMREN